MQRIIECKLVVESDISGKKDCVIVKGKGYYKEDNGEIIVYFSSDDVRYKYVYNGGILNIYCNDSCYNFMLNKKCKGTIKNGDYSFEITTFATKIDLYNNLIVLEYDLSQQGALIGKYKSELSF